MFMKSMKKLFLKMYQVPFFKYYILSKDIKPFCVEKK